MEIEYIKMLQELQSKYELELSNNDDYSKLDDKEMNVLIARRVCIRNSVLLALDFLIKDLDK